LYSVAFALVENNCCTMVCGLNKNDQKYYQTFVFFVAFRKFCDIIFFLTRLVQSLQPFFVLKFFDIISLRDTYGDFQKFRELGNQQQALNIEIT
jgi:hypothetical protein